tara:strand:- start:1743 stop:2264 length:522 start_codon:yes stop_codon:yes gene_type:complete
MTSRIEFITRGVKIMPRKRVGPVISGTPSKGSVGSYKGPGKKTNTRKTTPKKTTPKKTPVKKTVAKKTTPRKLPGRLGKIAALGTALGAGTLALMRRKDPTFGETFKKARKEKGPNSTFTYKGKKYSTVTQDQVKKAGYKTLREYLNAGGKKKKTGFKTKRRKTGGPPLRRRR